MIIGTKDGSKKEVRTTKFMIWWKHHPEDQEKIANIVWDLAKNAEDAEDPMCRMMGTTTPQARVKVVEGIMNLLEKYGWEMAHVEDLQDADLKGIYNTMHEDPKEYEGYDGIPVFAQDFHCMKSAAKIIKLNIHGTPLGKHDGFGLMNTTVMFENFFYLLRCVGAAVIGGNDGWCGEWREWSRRNIKPIWEE